MKLTLSTVRRSFAAFSLILIVSTTSGVDAAAVTYGIDLSGTDATSGHTVAVVGTITAETSTNSIDSSDLVVLHEGVETVPLLDAFRLTLEMEFEATDTAFRIAPQTDPIGTTVWTSDPTPPAGTAFAAMTLTETGEYTIQFVEDSSNPSSHADITAGVQLAGSPSNGYLIGTAIPEPSSAAWLSLGTFFTLQRRRVRN